jgi:uncharacterized glyoxalase superfamily protein PhnB
MSDPQFLRTIVVLPVADIEASTEWYGRVLGFEAVYRHEGDHEGEATNYAILRREETQVHLILDEPPHEPVWTKAGTGYLYLIVGDVDRVFDEVKSRGARIGRGLQTENWGARGFNLTDPSGNAIHIEQDR